MQLVPVVALALHTVAFVIAWGYYGILGRMVLPALERSLEPASVATTLEEIERRALPLVILSVILFVMTGTYLLVTDPSYAGLGAIDSTWATLMLVKHVAVIVLVALGVVIDFAIHSVAHAATEAGFRRDLGRLRWLVEGATAVGGVIALLTAAAQVSAA